MNNDWLPIESAPRDGTIILFWRKGYSIPALGMYADGHVFTGGLSLSPSHIPREWEDIATHWMPVPKSPFSTEEM